MVINQYYKLVLNWVMIVSHDKNDDNHGRTTWGQTLFSYKPNVFHHYDKMGTE